MYLTRRATRAARGRTGQYHKDLDMSVLPTAGSLAAARCWWV